ncbi:SDR family oxidoreductase [Pseudonocardia petroleophila]|uniref:SDR family oxidoreductase n=1 Tax=Pseudonocardia petroleophila TaxID=37331 RepID=A0A7G7MRF8_9PSEU|nr:SDR family oxidoreductase [Pseudonocardia petroleophila]QNG55369.1 SDR family oxidoreductase [Pseudonocardia petroleophila]
MELAGSVALVTAASKGIGRAIAERLAAEAATVALSSRDAGRVEQTIAELGPLAGALHAHPADLFDPAATEALVPGVVAAHGRLDVAVLNTPGPRIAPFLDTTDADWAGAYDLLVRPVVQLARAAARQMVQQGGGSIVFLTSTWVRQPAPGGVLSAAMRSALSATAKQMALELAPNGVRVNQVMPGATGTGRMEAILAAKAAANSSSRDEELAKVVDNIPLGRWGEPAEIADAVAFLSSPRSAFITGSTLAVDGGAIRSV